MGVLNTSGRQNTSYRKHFNNNSSLLRKSFICCIAQKDMEETGWLWKVRCNRGFRVISPCSTLVFYNTCSYLSTGFAHVLLIAWDKVYDVKRAACKELFDSVLFASGRAAQFANFFFYSNPYMSYNYGRGRSQPPHPVFHHLFTGGHECQPKQWSPWHSWHCSVKREQGQRKYFDKQDQPWAHSNVSKPLHTFS